MNPSLSSYEVEVIPAEGDGDQPPVIRSQPVGRSLCLGTTASLKVTAWGSWPLAYQWRKDGQDLEGARDATLTLANVSQPSAGDYTVIVSNAAGSITSEVAAVAVESCFAFDPGADFSVENGNPNGVWSYGWMPADFSAFYAYTIVFSNITQTIAIEGWARAVDQYSFCPHVWINEGLPEAGIPTGWLSLHPGPGSPGPGNEASVLRWTAPASGPVSIQGQFLPGNWGVMRVAIRLAGQTVWEAEDSGEFDLNASVSTGDTVDFAVFGEYSAGDTALGVTIRLDSQQVRSFVRTQLAPLATWAKPDQRPLYSVAASGTSALVTGEASEVTLVDLGSPARPALLGSWKSLFPVSDAELAGNLAYIASYESGFLSTIEIVDFSDPAKPVLRGYYDTPGHALEITLVANTAYVADGEAGLLILDVSDPTLPRRLGGYDTQGDVTGVRVAGHTAYVADGVWLLILDVSDPARPTRLGLHKVAGGISAFQVEGGTAYVHETGVGLHALDVSNPASVRMLATHRTWSQEVPALAVSGHRAYLARGLGGVQVVDVSNPTNLLALASAGVGGSARDVAVMGPYALVAAGEGGLKVFEFQQVLWPPLNPPVITDGMLTLSWPGMEGMRLQRATSLVPPDWQDVPGSDTSTNVAIPAVHAAEFFRLVKP
jgi:hypothetical protein